MKRVAMTLVGASLTGLALAEGGLDQTSIAARGLEDFKTLITKNGPPVLEMLGWILFLAIGFKLAKKLAYAPGRFEDEEEYDEDEDEE